SWDLRVWLHRVGEARSIAQRGRGPPPRFAVNLPAFAMITMRNFLLPPGTLPDARALLAARGLRAFGDGFVSLLLPYYLTLLGYGAWEIGLLVTATLLGSGLM